LTGPRGAGALISDLLLSVAWPRHREPGQLHSFLERVILALGLTSSGTMRTVPWHPSLPHGLRVEWREHTAAGILSIGALLSCSAAPAALPAGADGGSPRQGSNRLLKKAICSVGTLPGAAAYEPSTPRPRSRAACIWTFLSSLSKAGVISNPQTATPEPLARITHEGRVNTPGLPDRSHSACSERDA